MRKMASIQEIVDISPIDGADLICAYQVLGWWCVDQVGRYAVGDRVIYMEIDSFIPNHIAPFLSKGKEPRLYNGVRGERLKTVRLKKQLSQGLLLPVEVLSHFSIDVSTLEVDADVSAMLNIQKYEPPLPGEMGARLGGNPKGNFPGDIRKTDQTRIQSLVRDFNRWKEQDLTWTVEEKADGSSCTVYFRPEADEENMFGVCSRNFDLKFSEENSFWKVAVVQGFEEKLRSFGRNIALQGELVGEGIQKNPYKIKGNDFYLFDIYDITTQQYLVPAEVDQIADHLGIKRVPVIDRAYVLPETIDEILAFAEGKSQINHPCEREGLVLKCNELPGVSFKSISNKFLLKQSD